MINKIKNITVLSKLMKQFVFAISVIIVFLSISCKKENAKEENKAIEIKKDSIKEEVFLTDESKKQEEDFSYFIEKFSKDSVFQRSRVNFPIKIQLLDDDFELVEFIVEKEDYFTLNFIYPDDFIEFKQKIILHQNKATIEVRGTANGIMIDYFFEKIEGKWKLKTWIDSST